MYFAEFVAALSQERNRGFNTEMCIRDSSMTDKERMDVVERCYSKMKRYRNLVSYYTNKNISVSYLRAKKKNDLDRIMGLYGNMNERYW